MKSALRIGTQTCLTIAIGLLTASAQAGSPRLDADSFPVVGKVDQRFQSYNVEMVEVIGGRFWAPYPRPGAVATPVNTERSGGLDLATGLFRQREPLELVTNRRLRNLAKALGPAYIRVSGSWANTVYFQDDDQPRLAKPPKGFQGVLTRAQWAGVLNFAKAVDARIVMSFPVSEGARDANGVWKPDEARKLLRYTRTLGGEIFAAELINEPNIGSTSGLPSGYDAALFAKDIASFRDFVADEVPDMKTIGPGSTGETGVALFANTGIPTDALMSAQPVPRFDVYSYHFYGARSQRCARIAKGAVLAPSDALTEGWLTRTDTALAFYKARRDRFMPGAPIWLTETAEASCGGDQWASTFLDTFRYIDQMGRLAKQGVDAVFHNTLSASDYALIDEATLTPRPSYWAAVLWRRMMGDTVLDAGRYEPGFHVYAHCLAGSQGGVAIAAINLDRSKPKRLVVPTGGRRYTLTADILESGSVKLNGRVLTMAPDDQLPTLAHVVARGMSTLPPASITFLALPKADNRACR